MLFAGSKKIENEKPVAEKQEYKGKGVYPLNIYL